MSGAFWQQNLHHSDSVRRLLATFAIGELLPMPTALTHPTGASRVLDYFLTWLRGRQATCLQYEHAMDGGSVHEAVFR